MIFEVLEATTPAGTVLTTTDPATVSASLQQVDGDYLEVKDGFVQVKTTDGKTVAVLALSTNTMIRMQVK